ncbi:hypothetical protein EDD17DRAFT_1520519 [Pisolithus thermaeus]|nr:hypothetical protein EDD17DRAFT_1520519 [Pisolithus thermaeus]
MIDVIYEYVDIPDDPAPSRERSLPLPPMDDDVGALRAIPELHGEPCGRTNVLILGMDGGGHTQPLSPFSRSCGALTVHRNYRDADTIPTLSNMGSGNNMPDLSPDSSPASAVSSTMLMTPETGVSLADVEISPFLPLVESYFGDPVFGDDHCGDYTTSSFDDLEDSLTPQLAAYPFLDATPDGTACQSGDAIIYSTPTLRIDLPVSDPASSHLSVPGTQAQLGVDISGTLIPRPPSRSQSTPPAAAANHVRGSIDPSVTPVDDDLVAGEELLQKNNKEDSPRFPSPPHCSIPTKRRRVLETGDDDDDYVPSTRQMHSQVPSDGRTLPNKRSRRTKRCGARQSRSYLKPTSKSRSRCPHCRASFSRAGDMDRHQKSLACPVLKRKAEADGTLDEAKWPCPICGDKLSRNDSQARHFENTHPDVSPSDYGLKLRKREGNS